MKLFENEEYQKDLLRVVEELSEKACSILVTGATGLIGSFIVDVLLYANIRYRRQYEIYVMGRSLERLKQRFIHALNVPSFHLVEQDVCEKFPEELVVDYVISAASNADPYSYALYPVETILTNVLGTKNVLEHANKIGCKKVLFTSTMEVYGTGIDKEYLEEDDYGRIDFNAVRSGYPESKRTAELLCRSFGEEYEVPVVITRLGYIYGPTMLTTDNKVVAQFVRNIVNKEDVVMNSAGTQRRSYLYVADAVSAIFTVLFRGISGEAYNVASKENVISIRELAECAAKISGKKVIYDKKNVTEKKGISQPQANVLCDKKLKELSWNALYDIESGLRQTTRILYALGGDI